MSYYRWDIINHLIKKYNYKSFLEIGYYKGWSFDNVQCEFKIAVDPNPSKTPDQEKASIGSEIVLKQGFMNSKEYLYKATSDEFFGHQKYMDRHFGLSPEDKWDIIFIDGDHRAEQVYKDIENSLKYLSPGGVIVMHDCNPPTLQHTTTGDKGGNWNGTVYQAVLDFRDCYEGIYDYYCIDTDWGVGIIKKREEEFDLMQPFTHGFFWLGQEKRDSWEFFDKHRKELLNLISVEEFLKREPINETVEDHNLSA